MLAISFFPITSAMTYCGVTTSVSIGRIYPSGENIGPPDAWAAAVSWGVPVFGVVGVLG